MMKVQMNSTLRNAFLFSAALLPLITAGCKQQPPAAAPQFQAMPVQVASVVLKPVPQSDTYVATIKSRRSATLQPQVDGNLLRINVKSGDLVKSGQLLMTIDPQKQEATVQQQRGTEAQKLAVYEYNQTEVDRQQHLFEAGVISHDAYDQATQSYKNSKGDYESTVAQTKTQVEQLKYYQIRAPFDGVIGDIPVHVGDYVSPTTLLTTVDENSQLEAYIYVPTERAGQIRTGLPVEILGMDESGVEKVLARSSVSFLSPQVDNGLQSILAKAEVPRTPEMLRQMQLVKARITWSDAPAPVVPVLAVTRIGGQAFVYVAQPQGPGYIAHQVPVMLGDTVDNTYPVLKGLKPGDKVILSGIQFLVEGVPVKPLG